MDVSDGTRAVRQGKVVGMLKTYRSLLRIPHARAFVLAGFVARLYIHAGLGCRADGFRTHRLLRAGRSSRRSGSAGRGGGRSPAGSVGGPLRAAAGAAHVPRGALCRDARPRDFGSALGAKMDAVGYRNTLWGGGAAGGVASAGPVVGSRGRLTRSGDGVRAGVYPR